MFRDLSIGVMFIYTYSPLCHIIKFTAVAGADMPTLTRSVMICISINPQGLSCLCLGWPRSTGRKTGTSVNRHRSLVMHRAM